MFGFPPSSEFSRLGPVLPRTAKPSLRAGFTLIETVLAIGIVAFALVPMVALMPIGLTSFRSAIDTSMGCCIVQQVVTDIQQQGSSTLAQAQQWRYFDWEGSPLVAPTSAGHPSAVYWAHTAYQPTSNLPGGQSASLATVVIEIVNNPQNKQPVLAGGFVQPGTGMTVSRYPVLIATENL